MKTTKTAKKTTEATAAKMDAMAARFDAMPKLDMDAEIAAAEAEAVAGQKVTPEDLEAGLETVAKLHAARERAAK